MAISRRRFIDRGLGLGAGLLAYGRVAGPLRAQSGARYGDLVADPDGVVDLPDGFTWICEDGREGNFLRGLAPDGILYPIAFNAMNGSEFAGTCVSPDWTTVFVNIQRPGFTLAITGSWA